MNPPKGRYRIEERGRRLITIDTFTGREVSTLQGSAGVDEVKPRSAPASLGISPRPTPTPKTSIASPTRAGLSNSRIPGDTRQVPDLELPSLEGMGRQGRQMLVAVVGVIAALVIFGTGMWVLLILALVVSSDARTFAFRTLPGFARDFIEGRG